MRPKEAWSIPYIRGKSALGIPIQTFIELMPESKIVCGHSSVPLIADMSSNFFSRRIDIEKYGLIYAGCQKNLGPTGMVVVIANDDLIRQGRLDIPAIWQYRAHAEANSLYHTPPGFSIYFLHNFLDWVNSIGGLTQLETWNAEKARLIYAIVDRYPDFYRCKAKPQSRSRMNAVFRLPDELLEQQFVAEAQRAHMVGLTNHPTVGGLRTSLYNGVELKAVERLCEFMDSFALNHQPSKKQGAMADLHFYQ